MPRVTSVEKCRHSPGSCGRCGCKIKTGESYKWWKFRHSAKSIRCAKPECAPKSSELTQSEFWSAVYSLQENHFSGEDGEALASERDEVVSELEQIADELDDKKSNMPDSLQDSETANLLDERAEACRSVAEMLNSVDVHDGMNGDDAETAKEELESALQDFSCS